MTRHPERPRCSVSRLRQREAVVLRMYMGQSERQAAAAMRISGGAVRSHVARGLQTLRRPLGT